MTRHEVFENGVKNDKTKTFEIITTPNSLMAIQKGKPSTKKTIAIVSYDEFYSDFSYREKKIILKRLNDAIISKLKRKKTIELVWDEDVEEEMQNIICSNLHVWNEFDRE